MPSPLPSVRFGTLYIFKNPNRAQSTALTTSDEGQPAVTMTEPRFDEFRAQMKQDYPNVFVGRNANYSQIYVSTGKGPQAELDPLVEAAIKAFRGNPSKAVRTGDDQAINGAIRNIPVTAGQRRWFIADTAALGYYFNATGTRKKHTDPITDDRHMMNPEADAEAAKRRVEADAPTPTRSIGPGTLNRGPGGGKRRRRSGKPGS